MGIKHRDNLRCRDHLVDPDDVGQEGQSLDLGSDEVCIQLLVEQLVMPAQKIKHQIIKPGEQLG